MRHGVKKIKFKAGKDASQMLVRKLTLNFLKRGSLITTEARAKKIKPLLDKIMTKAKEETLASKNYLLSLLNSRKTNNYLFKQVGPAIKNKNSGFVKVTRMNRRISDGSLMVKLEWSLPVIAQEEKKVKKEKKEKEITKKI